MQRKYRGMCPFTNDEQTIHVNYTEIAMVQTRRHNYKKKDFECVHANECLKDYTCPIYQDAPKSITE